MTHPLERQIRSLRRRAQTLSLIRGAGLALTSIALAAACLVLVDYGLYRFFLIDDFGVRLLLAAALAAVTGVTLHRFLLPSVLYRWDDVRVAQSLERWSPQLGDHLSSSVSFLGQPATDPTAGSPSLRRAVIAETQAMIEQVPLHRGLRYVPAAALAAVAVVVCSCAAVALASSPYTRLAIKRLVLPLSDANWPKRHRLQFQPAVERLAASDDLELNVVDLNGPLPSTVEFHYRYEGQETSQQKTMKRFGDRMTIRLENVSKSMRYRATGGDDNSMDWQRLLVVEPPRIEKLTIRLHPPEYTGQPVAESALRIRALIGTKVEISGQTTKPLQSIELKFEGSQNSLARIGTLHKDGRSFSFSAQSSAAWTIAESGAYWLQLTDKKGLPGARPQRWQVHAVEDHPPIVSLDNPNRKTYVTPQAELPIELTVKDDLAVQAIDLHYVWSQQEEGQAKPLRLYAADAAPPAAGAAVDRLPETAGHRISHQWELADVGDLQPGQTIDIQAVAHDFLPQRGESTVRQLFLLSPEEMSDRIGQRQTYLLARLAEALRVARLSRSQTETCQVQLDKTRVLTQQRVDLLQSAELNQREVERLLASPSDGVEAQISSLLADLKHNRLDRADMQRRLTDLQQRLGRLNAEHLPLADRHLVDALKSARAELHRRQTGEQASERPVSAQLLASLSQAGQQQEQVIQILDQLLAELSDWDNFRRLSREIRRIAQQQAEINQQTEAARRNLIGKRREDLTVDQRAELEVLSRRQLELSRQFDATRSRMQRMREDLASEDTRVAQTIAKALDDARDRRIAGSMRAGGREIQSNRLGKAVVMQKEISQGLQAMQNILANRREREREQLLDRFREAKRQIEDFRERLDAAHEELAQAADQPSAAPRKRQLQQLAATERRLGQEIQRQSELLRDLQADPPADLLQQAHQHVQSSSRSAEQLKIDQATEQLQGARQPLETAQQQLERAIQQAEQQLRQRELEQLRRHVRGLVARQQAVADETQRLRASVTQTPPAPQSGMRELSQQQSELAAKTRDLAQQAAEIEVVRLALIGAANDMLLAAKLLLQTESDRAAEQAQRHALGRLQQVLDALTVEARESQPPTAASDADPPPDSPSAAEAMHRLVQLRLIRGMQQEINERTAQLEAARERAGDDLSGPQQEEMVRLAEQQGQLAELIMRITQDVQ